MAVLSELVFTWKERQKNGTGAHVLLFYLKVAQQKFSDVTQKLTVSAWLAARVCLSQPTVPEASSADILASDP